MKRAWLFRQFCHSLKIYSWLFIPNCTRNHVISYTNCGIALVQNEKRKFSTKGVYKSQISTVKWCQSWCSECYPGMCTYLRVCVCVFCDMLGRFSSNCPNPKQLLPPIATGVSRAMNQSESLAMTYNLLKAQEKSRLLSAIGFGFASYWIYSNHS